jgi:hypothetical protein
MRRSVILAAVAVLAAGAGISATSASAAATTQHIAVPAYFNPSGSTYWTQLAQSAPAVGVAIANPNNGPGTAFDQGYANAIRAAADAGVRVIGYVDTGYFGTTGRTTRNGQTTTAAWTTQSEGDVATWYSLYGSYGLGGIFFDDGLADCAHVGLYQAVNTYTKQNHAGAYTVDNPGTAAEQCYADAADTIVMFEGSYASYTGWSAPAWELGYADPNKFYHLVYATPSQANEANAMTLSKQRNAGYVYVTPDDLPNPWDTLPTGTYWSDELTRAGGTGPGGGTTTPPPVGSCASAPGSGAITAISACRDTTSLRFKATYNTAVSLHHVYLNTDNNAATGFQLPSPSPSRLGADYMIENNILYRSLSSGWSWAAVGGVSPGMTVSGSTYSWTVPLSALPGLAATQQAVFNGNTVYTGVLTYGQ